MAADVITPEEDSELFQKMKERGGLPNDELLRRIGALARLFIERGMGRNEATEEARKRMGF